MNPPQVYMCSPSWTLLPPPSPFHPSGSSHSNFRNMTLNLFLRLFPQKSHCHCLVITNPIIKASLFCCCSSVIQSCLTLCYPMDCSTPGFPVHHHLLELAQIQMHWVDDAIQPSCPLSYPSPSAFNLSQHQSFTLTLKNVSKLLLLSRFSHVLLCATP